MTLRAIPVAILVLICGPALAASPAIRPAPREAPTPPMVFYVAKGAPDACGRGCDSWIAVEGEVDSGAAVRFQKFLCGRQAIAICRCIFPRPAVISIRRWRWAPCFASGPPSPGLRERW